MKPLAAEPSRRTAPVGAITIGAPRLSGTADGRSRVGADVDGDEVWLAADAPLAANGDAWATMMFLPAAKSGATLRVESDLDSRLAANFERIREIASRHWGFPGRRVVADRLVERPRVGGDALFFTCGVDSFYALRRCRDAVGRLIYVRGLNINLTDPRDEAHWALVRHGVEAVARDLGIPALFAETNLRLHPVFSRVGWDVSHLAALAGVAHALAPSVARIHVATSEQRLPYGSDPTLDPLWGSSAVEIIGEGWEADRLGKIRAIADWPLVHRHLSVCYVSRGDALNCGACPKCVATQIRFEIAGARDRLEVFPKAPLRERVDAIRWLPPDLGPLWINMLPHVKDPALAAAVTRLLARRPSPVDWLRSEALWLRRSAPGRAIRRLAKRLLVE